MHVDNMIKHFMPGDGFEEEEERDLVAAEWMEFYSQTGRYSAAFKKPLPEAVSEEQLEKNNKAFTIADVQDWIKRTKGMEMRLQFFICYFPTSMFYHKVAKPLLSMKCVGSMDAERAAKPLKHSILTKERNRLEHEKAELLLRTKTNLRYLMGLGKGTA